MKKRIFPVIDPIATGDNILRLRRQSGLSVRDLQEYFGFEEPQAIYKWQKGKSLPSVDNLYALSALLEVPMENILVAKPNITCNPPQASACGVHFSLLYQQGTHLSLNRKFNAEHPSTFYTNHFLSQSRNMFILIMCRCDRG